ncbi:MAG: hypothetical protein WBD58_15460 [Geitlerinemataceae cyanobacterium]
MTPQLQNAIQAANILSPKEQIQLFDILASFLQHSLSLEAQSQAFWEGVSIETLLKLKNIPIVHDISTLAIDFWEDEPIDDFLAFLKGQRQANNQLIV